MNRKRKEKIPVIDKEHGLHLLKEMLRIRRLEEKCAELYTALPVRVVPEVQKTGG